MEATTFKGIVHRNSDALLRRYLNESMYIH